MRLSHIIEEIYTRPLAITPGGFTAIHKLIQSKLAGEIANSVIAADGLDMFGEELPRTSSIDDTAVIPVEGIIGRKIGMIGAMCGGCDLVTVDADLEAARANPAINRVVFNFDSPGGSVAGVPELAEKIRIFDKPTYAYVDGQCCSAAYWLASQTGGILATKSADVGSIGVYMALLDDTLAYAKEGYRVELFKAGRLKAMGLSGTSLTDEMRGILQAEVYIVYDWFTLDVRGGRGSVLEETMQGQSFFAEDAQKRNLIDGIVTGFDHALSEFKANKQNP